MDVRPLIPSHTNTNNLPRLRASATTPSISSSSSSSSALDTCSPQTNIHDADGCLSQAERDLLVNDTRIPKSVFFIVGNEFCERFTFYGIKAILFIYLTRYLRISSDSATALVHTFNMFAYSATLFGGILSDSYLGRYWTIVYLSLVYCVGNITLSLSAIPGIMPLTADGTPSPWGTILGLALLALGTGGIKPAVSAFGADQFHPLQVFAISIFFSLFYAAINSGSLLSMFITPILRSLSCFGRSDCFSIAFGLPSILMLVSTLIFVSGRRFYKISPPEGNVIGRVLSAIRVARREKSGAALIPLFNHWIDYASLNSQFAGSEGAKFLADVKQLLGVVWVFLPLPLFWTLYDQQGSRWTSQALLMDKTQSVFGLFSVEVKPDQMQVTNAILILAFIPIFQHYVYPRFRALNPPLVRMALGMALSGVSFVIAGMVQACIEKGEYGVLDASGKFQLVTDPRSRSKYAEQDVLLCVSGCVPILWQLPQYIVITVGEILFSITGLEFAYSQSPPSLKSVCQSAWQMTVAVGNLLVIIIAEARLFDPTPELFFFAGCIWVATLVFLGMTRNYAQIAVPSVGAYQEIPEDDSVHLDA